MKKIDDCYYLKEERFDDLFDECINLVTKNKDQGNKEIVTAISDIYEIKEYIPEIMMIEKKLDLRLLVFRYFTDPLKVSDNYYMSTSTKAVSAISNDSGYVTCINNRVIDLGFTLRSFYTFFSMYYFNNEINEFIEKSAVSEVILPALEKVLAYITKHSKEG